MPAKIVNKAVRYREYFGANGGITVSGGEPLLQAEFVFELFALCHKEGINTCLDTSGSILNDSVKKLLAVTDRVLLDYKYTTDALYKENVGCSIHAVDSFLEYLQAESIPVTLRQVIIPSLNDSEENILAIKSMKNKYSCIDKIELLPFRKICQVKYDKMEIPFRFAHLPEPSAERMRSLEQLLTEQELLCSEN